MDRLARRSAGGSNSANARLAHATTSAVASAGAMTGGLRELSSSASSASANGNSITAPRATIASARRAEGRPS
jgi:hypothetical protein